MIFPICAATRQHSLGTLNAGWENFDDKVSSKKGEEMLKSDVPWEDPLVERPKVQYRN